MSSVKRAMAATVVLALSAALLVTAPVAVGASPPGQTFVVTSNGTGADATPGDGVCATAGGVCTLRAALAEANAGSDDHDVIHFNLPGTGPFVFSDSFAQFITQPLTIDGTTQPGYAGAPLIVLDRPAGAGYVLRFDQPDNVVRGLTVAGNTWTTSAVGIGFVHSQGRNLLEDSYLGILPDGITADGNGVGVELRGDDNIVRNNLISANQTVGVKISTAGATGNLVQGNTIGSTLAGDARRPNQHYGVEIDGSPGNRVIGNLISGNGDQGAFVGAGVRILGATAVGNIVQGNTIGPNRAGTDRLGNGRNGVSVEAPGALIGGPNPGEGNHIAGNYQASSALTGRTNVLVNGDGDGTVIEGNLMGTDVTGTSPITNNGNGNVRLLAGADDVRIGGTTGVTPGGPCTGSCNVLSGPGTSVELQSLRATIVGNHIGVNRVGTALVSQPATGISISGGGAHQIGGPTPAERNVVAGYSSALVRAFAPATSVSIEGNFLGTDVTGNAAFTGQGAAVWLAGPNHQVRGNVIAGASDPGSSTPIGAVHVDGGSQVVQGNQIGVGADGSTILGNATWGITVPAGNATVGGPGVGEGNVIVGNPPGGILFSTGTTVANQNNDVIGNRIGVLADGTPAPNGGHGVEMDLSGKNNDLTGNVIAHNAGDGVFVFGTGASATDQHTFSENSIFANGGLGIDLYPNGVTTNDNNDADNGANLRQNFPVLTSAESTGSSVTIDGDLGSAASTAFTIEFFANESCDPSGHGEGERFLGSTVVTTGASGIASFTETFSEVVSDGEQITATATDPVGNTSEFSACTAAELVAPEPGTIVIEKRVTPGSDVETSFPFGGDLETSLAHGEDASFVDLLPGVYEVFEGVPVGWQLASIVCDDPSGGTSTDGTTARIVLAPGETVHCTFTNDELASVTIEKRVDPEDSGATFAFDFSNGAGAQLGHEQTAGTHLPAGTIWVEEQPSEGWRLASVDCGDAEVEIDGRRVTANLAKGEHLRCTFTNRATGGVSITQQAAPSDTGTSFEFVGDLGAFSLEHAETHSANPDTGSHTVTQSEQPGWTLVDIDCADNPAADVDVAARTVTLDVARGTNVSCTFVNQQLATVIVEKQTLPDGSSVRFSFDGPVAGPLGDGDRSTVEVLPGPHTVTEIAAGGWRLVGLTCSDERAEIDLAARSATFTLEPGGTIDCTFTNEQLVTLTVYKETLPDGSRQEFDFTGAIPARLGDGASATAVLPAGRHSLHEVGASGWTLVDIDCTDPDAQTDLLTGTASVDLAPGASASCTFTNQQDAVLTIAKETLPDGSAQPFSFTGAISATLWDGGTQSATLTPGSHSVTELATAGWRLIDISCSDGGAAVDLQAGSVVVNLGPGDAATCTFTNEQLGRITIEKLTDPPDVPDEFDFTGALTATLTHGGSATAEVVVGDHTVTELVPTGWAIDSILCDDTDSTGDVDTATATFRVTPGEHVRCTFTNEALPRPTTLVAEPATVDVPFPGLRIFVPELTATLTDTETGAPIAGKTITFTVQRPLPLLGSHEVCTAVTDADGVARCSYLILPAADVALSLGYEAHFAGDPPSAGIRYLASDAHGPLIRVLGIPIF